MEIEKVNVLAVWISVLDQRVILFFNRSMRELLNR